MDRLKYLAVDNKVVLVIVSSSTHARLMSTHSHKVFAVKGVGHEVLVIQNVYFSGEWRLIFFCKFFCIHFYHVLIERTSNNLSRPCLLQKLTLKIRSLLLSF